MFANTSCFLLLLVSLVVVVTVVAFLAFLVIGRSSKFRRWVIPLHFLISISKNLWNSEVDCLSANQSSFVEAFCSISDVGFSCYNWIRCCLKQGRGVFFLSFISHFLFGCSDGLDDCWDVVCDDFNLVAAMAAHILIVTIEFYTAWNRGVVELYLYLYLYFLSQNCMGLKRCGRWLLRCWVWRWFLFVCSHGG